MRRLNFWRTRRDSLARHGRVGCGAFVTFQTALRLFSTTRCQTRARPNRGLRNIN